MKDIFIIYPNNLYEHSKQFKPHYHYILIEEPFLFGNDVRSNNMSKLKLGIHRAGLKYYYDFMKKKGYSVEYVEYNEAKQQEQYLSSIAPDTIHIFDPVDHPLLSKIKQICRNIKVELRVHDTQSFVISNAEIEKYLHTSSVFSRTNFYLLQRRTLNEKIHFFQSKGTKIEEVDDTFSSAPYIDEAINYVEEHFSNNIGSLEHLQLYPVTYHEINTRLMGFLQNTLNYLDGLAPQDHLPHSMSTFENSLGYALNSGLLNPSKASDKAIKFYLERGSIGGLEYFVKQIIFWREYGRLVYVKESENLRESNVLNLNRVLKQPFQNTKFDLKPLDEAISLMNSYGYLRDFPRLFVANFLNLCDIHPKQVYQIFTEFAVDSSESVVLANVYDRAVFANGGQIDHLKNFHSSLSICKRLGVEKGLWCDIWDALYYRFLNQHWRLLIEIGGFDTHIAKLNVLSSAQKKKALKIANDFIEKFTTKGHIV